MRYHFLPEAEQELWEAIDEYGRITPLLGSEFAAEVAAAIDVVLDAPLRGAVFDDAEGEVRRYLIHRFPYALLYGVEGDEIEIISVMHLHRQPGYWRGRR